MKSNIFDCVAVPRKIMMLSGLWPMEKACFAYKIKGVISHLLLAVLNVMILVEIVKDLQNLNVVLDLLTTLASAMSCFIKLLLFTKSGREFVLMLKYLQDPIFSSYEINLDIYMQDTIKKSNLLARSFQGFCTIVISSYSLAFLSGNGDLPVPFTYYSGRFQYWMIYIFQTVALGCLAAFNSCLDLTPASLMGVASAHFKILAKKIENSSSENSLKNCVEHHMAIIRYVELIEDIFTYNFMAQFMDSILVICTIGFQLANAKTINVQFVKFVFYFFTMMFQLALYCWFGQEVLEASLDIRSACYFSKWHERGAKVKKIIFIIMERSKRPSKLTAAKFSTLSLASFASVMQSSYSYFALLQQVYNKDDQMK